MYLFMDDYRPCPPGFKLARDAEECLLLLHEYPITILSLDYDLGSGQPTGKDVAAAIAGNGYIRVKFTCIPPVQRGGEPCMSCSMRISQRESPCIMGPYPRSVCERSEKGLNNERDRTKRRAPCHMGGMQAGFVCVHSHVRNMRGCP